jgi:hypothetical protein
MACYDCDSKRANLNHRISSTPGILLTTFCSQRLETRVITPSESRTMPHQSILSSSTRPSMERYHPFQVHSVLEAISWLIFTVDLIVRVFQTMSGNRASRMVGPAACEHFFEDSHSRSRGVDETSVFTLEPLPSQLWTQSRFECNLGKELTIAAFPCMRKLTTTAARTLYFYYAGTVDRSF